MQDEPNPEELLQAVASFLRSDILPQLEGGSAFQLRVAANALDLVRRQIMVPPEAIAAEHEQLRTLLGRDGGLAELTAELAGRIADRSIDLEAPGLEAFLWSSTEAKLAVDQPHYGGLVRAQALRAARLREEE